MADISECLEKLNRKTIKDEITGCWLWQGGLNAKGYGQIYWKGHCLKVHRVSACIHLGVLPDSKEPVCHKPICPNKNCWNPDHLYSGTYYENTVDAILAGKHSGSIQTECDHGHKFTEENTYYTPNGDRRCNECSRINAKYSRTRNKID